MARPDFAGNGRRTSAWLTVAALALAACASSPARPPREAASRAPDLVELVALDDTLRLDIRYATADNLVGRPVYREARAFLQRPAAEALVAAHRELRAKGYGIVVFDGYRPWRVTRDFWDSVRKDQRAFVANPRKGSKHNRGCAIDVTLYDLSTGRTVEMPSAYDETSERASPGYAGGSSAARARRDVLRAAMEAHGFTVEPNEWWHFNHEDWPSYPILDIPFEDIARPPR